MKKILLLNTILTLFLFGILNIKAQDKRYVDSLASNINSYLYEVRTERIFIDEEYINVRIMLFHGGWEHVSSELVFQWIKNSPEDGEIISQKYFIEAPDRFWLMQIKSVEKKDNAIYIKLNAKDRYSMAEREFQIMINSIGEYDTLDSNFEVKVE